MTTDHGLSPETWALIGEVAPTLAESLRRVDPDYRDAEAYLTAIAEIEALVTAARSQGVEQREAWRPIESAPKDGTDVLLWGVHRLDGQRQFVGGWWPAAEDWATEDGEVIRFPPTHWMPLPAPPKAPQAENNGEVET